MKESGLRPLAFGLGLYLVLCTWFLVLSSLLLILWSVDLFRPGQKRALIQSLKHKEQSTKNKALEEQTQAKTSKAKDPRPKTRDPRPKTLFLCNLRNLRLSFSPARQINPHLLTCVTDKTRLQKCSTSKILPIRG